MHRDNIGATPRLGSQSAHEVTCIRPMEKEGGGEDRRAYSRDKASSLVRSTALS